MRALEKLPSSEKLLMLPIVLLAPWLNSIEFSNTHGIIKKSIGDAPIIVDIDRFFRSDSSLPSRVYFRELVGGTAKGIDNWLHLIDENKNYIPTILFNGVTEVDLERQISFAKGANRGFVFRIDPNSRSEFSRIREAVSECQSDDILIIIDFGYRNDYLQAAHETSEYLRSMLDISEELRFVVCGSNFPNAFSDFDDFAGAQPIGSRLVYLELLKSFGNYQLFYGDWASTKPRKYDGGGNTPLPRIDFPTPNSWIIARSREQQWSFQEAARRITRVPEWDRRPVVWGTGMIEKTAEGLPGGISTGPEAIAARVNTHLYVQNHIADSSPPPPPEQAWVDPI